MQMSGVTLQQCDWHHSWHVCNPAWTAMLRAVRPLYLRCRVNTPCLDPMAGIECAHIIMASIGRRDCREHLYLVLHHGSWQPGIGHGGNNIHERHNQHCGLNFIALVSWRSLPLLKLYRLRLNASCLMLGLCRI